MTSFRQLLSVARAHRRARAEFRAKLPAYNRILASLDPKQSLDELLGRRAPRQLSPTERDFIATRDRYVAAYNRWMGATKRLRERRIRRLGNC